MISTWARDSHSGSFHHVGEGLELENYECGGIGKEPAESIAAGA